jgi:hypothetical protein
MPGDGADRRDHRHRLYARRWQPGVHGIVIEQLRATISARGSFVNSMPGDDASAVMGIRSRNSRLISARGIIIINSMPGDDANAVMGIQIEEFPGFDLGARGIIIIGGMPGDDFGARGIIIIGGMPGADGGLMGLMLNFCPGPTEFGEPASCTGVEVGL